jgi:MFS family permease
VTTAEPLALPRAPVSDGLTLRSRAGRLALGGFSVAHFAHHVTNSLLNALLPFIRDAFALSYTQSGLAVSAFALSAGLANAPLGAIADRVGHRRVIALGLAGMAAASVALSSASAYWQLLLFLVAMGIASGTYHAPAAALIARMYAPAVRGAAMGFHITAGHLSFFAAPLVASVLASVGSWRLPYVVFAAAPLACAVLVWLIAPRAHRPPPASAVRFAAVREMVAALRAIGPLLWLSVIFQLGLSAVLAFLALFLVDARGISPAVAAALFGFPQLAGMLGAPFGGALSDRLGRRTVLVLALGLLGPAVFSLTVVPNELILAPLLAIGFVFSMRATVTEVLVMDSAPSERRGTVLGGYYLLNAEIGGLAAPVFGFVAVAVGIGTAFSALGLAFLALSALAALLAPRLARG